MTGDNIYPRGASHPNDQKFQKYFYEKYLKFPGLSDRVFFIVLGNHDYNFRNYNQVDQKSGFEVAINEIIHTFLNKKGEIMSFIYNYFFKQTFKLKKVLEY